MGTRLDHSQHSTNVLNEMHYHLNYFSHKDLMDISSEDIITEDFYGQRVQGMVVPHLVL